MGKRGRKPAPTENAIVEILHNRDGISYREAIEMVLQVRDEILAAVESGEIDYAEDLMVEYFGLEPEYIIDLY